MKGKGSPGRNERMKTDIFVYVMIIVFIVTSFSVAVAVDKKRRFSVDNLVISVQPVDVSTRCSSHPQGNGEVRCQNAEAL